MSNFKAHVGTFEQFWLGYKAQGSQHTMDPNKAPSKSVPYTDYDDFLQILENTMDEAEINVMMAQCVDLMEKLVTKQTAQRDRAAKAELSRTMGDLNSFTEIAKAFRSKREAPSKTGRRLEAAIEQGLFKGFNGVVVPQGFKAEEDAGFT